MILPNSRLSTKKKHKRSDSFIYTSILWVSALSMIIVFFMNNYAQMLFPLQGQMEEADDGQPSGPTTFPLHLDLPPSLSLCQNQVTPLTQFAIVAYHHHPGLQNYNYYQAAAALGSSIMAHTNLDLILLTTTPVVVPVKGWMMCYIQPASSNGSDALSYMSNKMLAWKLTEYKALLLLDLDILVIRNPTALFTFYYSQMIESNKTLAAVGQTPCLPSPFQSRNDAHMAHKKKVKLSAAVLLLIPSTVTYLRMKKFAASHLLLENHTNSQSDTQSPSTWLFRTLVHDVFQKGSQFFDLPPEYNTNIIWRFCNPEWWRQAKIKLLHFTTVKPWSLLSGDLFTFNSMHPWACWASGVSDLCDIWKHYFEITLNLFQ